MQTPFPLLPASLALLATLCCSSARATVCNPVVPAACVNTYSIYNQPANITLTSDLRYFGPIVQLRYVAQLFSVDALLTVRWTEANGATLLHAENTFGWFNSHVSWTREWVGIWFPNPSVSLLTGSADFNGSFPRPNGCNGGICNARYYDWTANVAPDALAVGSALAAPLPPGFEGVTETASALQSVVLSPTDPGNLEAATFTDQYRFASSAANDAGQWRYRYTFENLSDVAVDFALAGLGFAGTAEAGTTATLDVLSSLSPGALNTGSTIRLDEFMTTTGAFQALVPLQAVPESRSVVLMLAGLAVLAGLARRRRH